VERQWQYNTPKVTLKEILHASKQIIYASVGLLEIEIQHVTMRQFNPMRKQMCGYQPGQAYPSANVPTIPTGLPLPVQYPVLPLIFSFLFLTLSFMSMSCGHRDLANIDDILVSGPEVVEITATSARILTVTSINVACAVTYGETTEYGQMATDLDMAGGGHRNHKPLLTNLKPDTTYHFSFGGVGARRQIFRGGDFTFKTLSAPLKGVLESTDNNLALSENGSSIVGVSSNFGGVGDGEPWGSQSAIDGDPRTEWSSNGDGDDAWIEIELPAEIKVTSVGFWTRTMGASSQILSFKVTTDVGETAGPFQLDDASASKQFNVDLRANRLRFEAEETTGGNTGAVEIEVYGEAVH